MLRRKCLQLTVASLLSPLVAQAAGQDRKRAPKPMKLEPVDVVVDQSGVIGAGSFVIGALTMTNPTLFLNASAQVRKTTKYKKTLLHASRDKWKYPFAVKLIDAWFSTPGMRIDVLVVKESKNDMQERPPERLNRYVELVGRLVDQAPAAKGDLRRLVWQRHLPSKQLSEFSTLLKKRNARVQDSLYISERDTDALQLVDLVVGAIRTDQPGMRPAVTNDSKTKTIQYLRKKAQVQTFGLPIAKKQLTVRFV